uniref:Uncharacterized protein n=1 Tax=Bionectria ochroleuca TaxID=29856 RepID=A0A8H7N778_BIOOC
MGRKKISKAQEDKPVQEEEILAAEDQEVEGHEQVEKAPKLAPEENPKFFFTKHDGFYRSFREACEAAIEDRSKAPTAVHLAGALMGMKDLDMGYLPMEWHVFAKTHPDLALLLRRSVHEMTLRGLTDEDKHFKVGLPDAARCKVPGGVEVANYTYLGGLPNPDLRKGSKKMEYVEDDGHLEEGRKKAAKKAAQKAAQEQKSKKTRKRKSNQKKRKLAEESDPEDWAPESPPTKSSKKAKSTPKRGKKQKQAQAEEPASDAVTSRARPDPGPAVYYSAPEPQPTVTPPAPTKRPVSPSEFWEPRVRARLGTWLATEGYDTDSDREDDGNSVGGQVVEVAGS